MSDAERVKTPAEEEAAKDPENERYLRDINTFWNDRAIDPIQQNNLSLTLGYGALYSALFWLRGNVPDYPFFIALGSVTFSICIFFFLIFYEGHLKIYYWSKHLNLYQTASLSEVYENYCRYYGKARFLYKYWYYGFWTAIILAGISAFLIISMCYSFIFKENYSDTLAILSQRNAVLEAELDAALKILHQERLMHFER